MTTKKSWQDGVAEEIAEWILCLLASLLMCSLLGLSWWKLALFLRGAKLVLNYLLSDLLRAWVLSKRPLL